MRLVLTENDFKGLLTEMVKEVLLLEADTKVIRARNGCAPYLEKFGDIKEAFKKFREDFYGEGLMDNNMLWTLQLAPMFCKFAVENGWTPTTGVINEVKKILFEIVIHHGKDEVSKLVNEFKNNPNEITWSSIHDKYQPFIDERQEQENARISQNQYTKDNRYNYKIYGPLTFEQAKEFGDYSRPNGEICYTQGKGTWNSSSYTAKNTRKVYVLVLPNWKDIPCEHTPDGYITHKKNGDPIPADNNGYDLYGMSMIFLIVNKLGDLVVSNTRWNHGGSGRDSNIDHMFTKEDIYKLIGSEKADNIFNSPYQSIQDALNKGVSIEELFDGWKNIGNGIAKVELNGKFNFFSLEKQDYLFPNLWFDYIWDSDKNGWTKCVFNNFHNYFNINTGKFALDNNVLSNIISRDVDVPNELGYVIIHNNKFRAFNVYDVKNKKIFYGELDKPETWLNYITFRTPYLWEFYKNKKVNIYNLQTHQIIYGDFNNSDSWCDEISYSSNNNYPYILKKNNLFNYFSFDKGFLLHKWLPFEQFKQINLDDYKPSTAEKMRGLRNRLVNKYLK